MTAAIAGSVNYQFLIGTIYRGSDANVSGLINGYQFLIGTIYRFFLPISKSMSCSYQFLIGTIYRQEGIKEYLLVPFLSIPYRYDL